MGEERRPFRRCVWALLLGLALATPALGLGVLLSESDYENAPIHYRTATPHNPVTELQDRLDQGATRLEYDSKHGYLLSTLQQLRVPVSSQMLVFSKTSFQSERISPRTPRALYFNDRVYVGWVQGGDYIEVATDDPQLGAVFYLLPQTPGVLAKFIRQPDQCLRCHSAASTNENPGFLMFSVFANREGKPLLSAGVSPTSDQSSLPERWGGWYVTGTQGYQRHRGNLTVQNEMVPERTAWGSGGNITDLSRFVDTKPYLSPHSDMVALMVFGHQTHIQNEITRAGFETRRALYDQQKPNPEPGQPADTTANRIQNACEPLVKALLFSHEARLTEPIAGTSDFARDFAAIGPRDRKNRSLRQFDLKSRLFRYPCSYLVYSPAFDSLPEPAKAYVYRRFEEILSGKDKSPDFARTSDEDRRALLEILRDTKPDFAAWEAKHPAS